MCKGALSTASFWGWLLALAVGCSAAGPDGAAEPEDYGPAPAIAELFAEGRDGIIRRAVGDVKRRLPAFDLHGFDRILAQHKGDRIRVIFEMPVRFIPLGATERDHHYRVMVEYRPDKVVVTPTELRMPPPNPFWPLPLSGYGVVLPPHIQGSIHDDVEIQDEGKVYAFSVLHADGTAEGYHWDKARRVFEMTWTETPPKGQRILQRDRRAAADGWVAIPYQSDAGAPVPQTP